MGAKQQPRVPAVSPCSCKNCTRMGSNRSPSVRLFCRASFRVSAAGVPPNFTGFLHLPSINFAVRRRRKRELVGGTLNRHFQPSKSRHAQRGYPMLAPAEPTKKSDARSRIPLSLVPDSLAPRPSLPRPSSLTPSLPPADGFFEAWLTSMLRGGRRHIRRPQMRFYRIVSSGSPAAGNL